MMIWPWLRFLVCLMMLASDVAWWVLAFRFAKNWFWRVLASVFMAVQTAAILSVVLDFKWAFSVPKAVFVSLVLWHYLAVAVFFVIGDFLLCRWLARKIKTRLGLGRQSKPVKTEDNTKETSVSVTRREFLGNCAAAAPMVFNIGLTSAALAQLNQFRVRRFDLSMPALPRALDGLTIAHVSDLHVGPMTCGQVLRDMVEAVNALQPDLVLLTGDLIHYELSALPEAIATVQAMRGRYGQWMIEGNHDLFQDGEEFGRRVRAAGIPYLVNESAISDVRGFPVQFFGLGWMDAPGMGREKMTALHFREMLKRREPGAFPILLAHHPHAFDEAMKAGIPLTLSGHTHGGQWMLNKNFGIGPTFFRYWSGLYQRDGSQLIVSNGAGNVFPIRINAPAEIVRITLRCA